MSYKPTYFWAQTTKIIKPFLSFCCCCFWFFFAIFHKILFNLIFSVKTLKTSAPNYLTSCTCYLQIMGRVTSMTWGASWYLPPECASSSISETILSKPGRFSFNWSMTSAPRKYKHKSNSWEKLAYKAVTSLGLFCDQGSILITFCHL